jgi:hypothetical protein
VLDLRVYLYSKWTAEMHATRNDHEHTWCAQAYLVVVGCYTATRALY